MRNNSFNITVPQSSSPISAFSAENKSHIIALRFMVHETLQINQSNFQISNNVFVQFLWVNNDKY